MAIKFGKLVGGWRVVEKYKLLLSSFRRSRLHYCTLGSCIVPPLTRARNDAFSGKGLDALLRAATLEAPCSFGGGWGMLNSQHRRSPAGTCVDWLPDTWV